MVEKKNCRLAQWFHPVGVTRERRLPAVNPGMGPTIRETVLGTGVTPGRCIQGVKAMNRSFLVVPHMGLHVSLGPDCESRYRDAMVEKTNCHLAQGFHPVVLPGRGLLTVNPSNGAYHWRNCAWHRRYTQLVQSGSIDYSEVPEVSPLHPI